MLLLWFVTALSISMRKNDTALISFISSISEALAEEVSRGESPPTVRRKLRTVTQSCGARASQSFLGRLADRLSDASIYTRPSLAARGLTPDSWIEFSLRSFPADELLFVREKALCDFIAACLGSGVFRDLKPYREGAKVLCREYRLPNGQKIDLLCEEKSTGTKGALVAMEIKRSHEVGVVEQLLGYLRALKLRFPERQVRGVIVTGRSDPTGLDIVQTISEFSIEWFCYSVQFARVEGQATPVS